MKNLAQNTNSDYDFDLSQMGYQVDTLSAFCEAEKHSVKNLGEFLNSKLELKCHNRAISTANIFLEYEIIFKGELQPSGIATSKADKWLLTFGDSGVYFPTEFLRDIYLNKESILKRFPAQIRQSKSNYDERYVGIGLMVPFALIFDLHTEWLLKNRLKNLNR